MHLSRRCCARACVLTRASYAPPGYPTIRHPAILLCSCTWLPICSVLPCWTSDDPTGPEAKFRSCVQRHPSSLRTPRARLRGRGGSPQNPPYSIADPRRVTTRSPATHSSADCSSRFAALTAGSFGPLPAPAVLIGFTAAAAELAAAELAATTELTLGDCHPNHSNGVISCRATHRSAVE